MITPRADFDMSEASSPAPSPFRPLVTRFALLLGVASGACGGNTPNQVVDTIDRETFLEVYVDLRSVALRKTSGRVSAVERDSVLAMHEVTEESLRFFLEAHHTEADFMRDLWNDAEARISVMLRTAGEGSEGDG